ncbi:MAG: hypothetical protein ACR2PT_24305 [Endozoicomonas sp.]
MGYLLASGYQPSTGFANFDAVDRSTTAPFRLPMGGGDTSGSLFPGETSDNLPVSVESGSRQGQKIQTFFDDYYNRIHVTPADLDLGNLLSAQTREVEVWNAYTSGKTLSEIDAEGTDGIHLGQPAVPPLSFNPLESRAYTVQITVNGPPVINGRYGFRFGSDTSELEITGRRVVVWPYIPQADIRESLEWKTDVLKAYSGEQRLALRQTPRQFLTYRYQLEPDQFSRAKAIAGEWAHRVYGVPVWGDSKYLGVLTSGTDILPFDTRYSDYRDDDVLMVWQSDEHYEALETVSVTQTGVRLKTALAQDYSQAYVMPLRFGRAPKGVRFRRSASDVIRSDMSFVVTDGVDLSAGRSRFSEYRGYEVLEDRSVLQGDMSETIARELVTIDNGRGVISVDPETSLAQHGENASWHVLDKKALWHLRQWLYSRRGRQKAFWLPSWNQDIEPVEPIGASSTGLVVKSLGYSLYYGIRDVMIRLQDGTVYYRRILGGSAAEPGREVLSMDRSLGRLVEPADIDRISFLTFTRFNSDRIELSHDQGGGVSVRVPTLQIKDESHD